MPAMKKRNRVIALDLPGFGASSKPADGSYSFRFHARALDGFCATLGIEQTVLAVHDLGGPVGLYWTLQQPDRITRLALLNTLVYRQMSWAVIACVTLCRTPGLRAALTAPAGLRWAMRFGVHHKQRLGGDVIAHYQQPFAEVEACRVLAKTAYGLHPRGGRRLPGDCRL